MPLIVAGTLAAAAIGLLLALSFRSFDAQGSSMEPELSAGDSLIVARVAYEEVDFGLLNSLPLYDSSDLRWGPPGRGDAIRFHPPVRDQQPVTPPTVPPGHPGRFQAGLLHTRHDGRY